MAGLTADPLFQLNLLLWCCLPTGPDGVARIFRDAGYEVISIAPRLRPAVSQLARLRSLGSQDSASPELVLYASGKRHLLVLECKASSFSSASSVNVAQLITLLAVEGDVLRDAIGLHPSIRLESSLGYVVPNGTTGLMSTTLEDISRRLISGGHKCHLGFALLLDERADGIYAGIERPEGLRDGDLRTTLAKWPRVLAWDGAEDWRPLYLLPIDPSIAALDSDAVGRQVLEERIRAPMLARIGRKIGPREFVIDVDDLLADAIPVWDLWDALDAKKALRTFALSLVRTVAQELRGAAINVVERNRQFTIAGTTIETAGAVRRALRRSAMRGIPLDLSIPEQTGLFEE